MDLSSVNIADTTQIWEFSPAQPEREATASNLRLHSHPSHCLLRSANRPWAQAVNPLSGWESGPFEERMECFHASALSGGKGRPGPL